jgi:hypothetical protein
MKTEAHIDRSLASVRRRERNRKGPARYLAPPQSDLSRVQVDVRPEVRAMLERLSTHFTLSLGLLVEQLAADRERAVLAELRPEEVEVYLASDAELLAAPSRTPGRPQESERCDGAP